MFAPLIQFVIHHTLTFLLNLMFPRPINLAEQALIGDGMTRHVITCVEIYLQAVQWQPSVCTSYKYQHYHKER